MERRFSVLNAPFDIFRLILSVVFFYLSFQIVNMAVIKIALFLNYVDSWEMNEFNSDTIINVIILIFSLSILLTIGFYKVIGGKFPIYIGLRK